MEKGDKNIRADVLSKSGKREDEAINFKVDVFLFPLFYAKPGKTNIINSYWIVHLFVDGITLIQFFFFFYQF